jgi:hypothetical protein
MARVSCIDKITITILIAKPIGLIFLAPAQPPIGIVPAT